MKTTLSVNGKPVDVEVDDPSTGRASAAIANAVFDAVAVRLRSVRFLSEKVLAALKIRGRAS
jgi:hypothetical protein